MPAIPAPLHDAVPGAGARGHVRFYVPFEHGAWWAFFSCLAIGLLQNLHRPLWALALALSASMACLFLASDWASGLLGAFRAGRIQSLIQRDNVWGWFLLTGGLTGISLTRAGLPVERRAAWDEALAAGALYGLFVLGLRLRLKPRHSLLLILSSLLLTLPGLYLGGLAFGGFTLRAWDFWGLLAAFFSCNVFYVQTWMRAGALSKVRLALVPAAYLGLSLLLAGVGSYPGSLSLSALALRASWRLWRRAQSLRSGAATRPAEIRALGWEQVGWSLVLLGIWTWRFW
jgi:hypothetical protein